MTLLPIKPYFGKIYHILSQSSLIGHPAYANTSQTALQFLDLLLENVLLPPDLDGPLKQHYQR